MTRADRLRVVALTGAGVSADSGLVTFRGPGGLWEGYRAAELATPAAWAHDPWTVWRFYQMRRAQLGSVQPNPAHVALARLERALTDAGHEFRLISQNVDDLHQRAGSHVISMHGQLVRLRCERCGGRVDDREHLEEDVFVPCGACGHERLRPDVVWFGEVPLELERIEHALRACTHFASIGTSGVVYPAAALLARARAARARTWVNNLDPPENLHPRDLFVPGRAAEVVPDQVERWIGEWTG